MEIGIILIKLVSGFVALIICMKITGAKGVSNLTPIDFIWSIMLSEIMGNGIYDTDVAWYVVLITLSAWCILKISFDFFMFRFDKIEIMITGKKDLIIEDGKLDEKVMKDNRIDNRELSHALRKQGIFSIDEIKHAYLERDGTVSVQKKKEFEQVTKKDLSVNIMK